MAAQAPSVDKTADIRLSNMYGDERRVSVTEEDTMHTLLEKASKAWNISLNRVILSFGDFGFGKEVRWGLIKETTSMIRLGYDQQGLLQTFGIKADATEVALDVIKKTKLTQVGLSLGYTHLVRFMFRVAEEVDDGKK